MENYYYYIDTFIYNIENNINFAFAHFNDGEISLILGKANTISRGMQKASNLLKDKLLLALQYQSKNYYAGIPCSICFPEYHKYCININNNLCTPACIFHHTKLTHLDRFLLSLENKKIYWFVNNDMNLNNLKKKNYNIDISSIYIIPSKNAFDKYEEIRNKCDFENNSIVILLCGPIGRILTHEFYQKNNNVTYLCLGSYFDSILTNKKYGYDDFYVHKNCPECFNKKCIKKKIEHS